MRYRIKTETLNNGTQYFTAQVCNTPPYAGWFKWLQCFHIEVWCSITSYGEAYNEAYCSGILDSVRQKGEGIALICIEAFKRQLAKQIGEQASTTEYKYL